MLLLVAGRVQASGWRGIVPLHSTRIDVERLLGPPTRTVAGISVYELERESALFHFAKGPCGVESSGWNVPRDTVTAISVTPKPNLLKLADLKLDESKFIRKRDAEVGDVIHYVNEEEGITYEIDMSYDNAVTLITYYPAREDANLRCPSSRAGLEGAIKFDSYSNISFKREKKHLDNFAEQIRRYTIYQVYIVTYAGKRARGGEARARAQRAKDYLTRVRGIESRSILIIDGGKRTEPEIELYLVSPGAIPSRSRSV
jgi:outer membrane protein OmpA-like peptidoglycan-associated protein